MNERPDNHLLNDVLSEPTGDFRADSLARTLREARRRQWWRQARKISGVFTMLALAAWLVLRHPPHSISVSGPAPKTPARSYELVESQPMPKAELVTTSRYLDFTAIPSMPAITQVTTSSNGMQFINDAQLLTLAGPGAAVLVRTGPNSQELVFAASARGSGAQPN